MYSIEKAKRIVVKVGSSTLTHDTGRLNLNRLEKLVRTLSDLKNSGKEIILVTSGAIAVGISKLGFAKKPETIPQKQAAAAVGQCELMYLYDKLFCEYGHVTAQVLLTREVTDEEVSRNNVINTLNTLLSLGVIPIANENDTVSYYEIDFGDNDTLSAIVATLVRADALIILSDVDGMFDKNPQQFPNAHLIPIITEITPEIKEMATDTLSKVGTGGMAAKISAASICHDAKIDMVIQNGQDPACLYDIFNGKIAGTFFHFRRDLND